MSAEILINVTAREVRAAVVESGVLQEVLIERASRRALLGNIYKGRVSRVLPGMQAAFVEIGLERTAFLHTSDIAPPPGAPAELKGRASAIRDLLREGDEILVQVLKDPIGTKGARLTTFITVPSRYLVLLPRSGGIGISSRIESETERERLKQATGEVLAAAPGHGVIVRTAAEGAPLEALRADMDYLVRLWERIERSAREARPGSLVHADLPLAVRVARDIVHAGVERVRVDSADAFARLREFAAEFMPGLGTSIELYADSRPILDLYGVEDEVQKALQDKVPLKSGGYIVIEQTEAMTTVDVNTGGYVGHRNLEETIFRTNLEAAVAIARQLRLRNLGGIIIIDFIDMEEPEHRAQVIAVLRAALDEDHAHTDITQVSPLGLVEMTRKRTRESLEHVMCQPCPTCAGRGSVKTPETVCYEIFREILRQHGQFDIREMVVLAHQDVIELLLDEESGSLAELSDLTGKPIRLQAESQFAPDRFDVVLI
ncbi:MAG: ribonuclease G [Gammaproteobacteria bacterium]|nr:ribonuclease G [Gammaproteobacteria bacterium]